MKTKLQNYFFFALLIGALVLTFYVFMPYVKVLVLASVLAVVFSPLTKKIQKSIGSDHPSLAALVTLLLIILIVMTPLFFIGTQISFEARDLYLSLSKGNGIPLVDVLNSVVSKTLQGVFPGGAGMFGIETTNLHAYVQQVLAWAFSNIDNIFHAAAKFIFDVFILILALFYMIRDGKKLMRHIIKYSPLSDVHDEQIFKKLSTVVQSVIKGSLVVGLIQGVLTGIGFALFGIPNPALWGSFAVIAALIPGIGTSLVLIPGILYLVVVHSLPGALGLLAWSVLAVGLVDNILGPYFVNRGAKIHQFLILLSVIGGLSFFGPIGFIMGPLVLALLFALLEIYKTILVRET